MRVEPRITDNEDNGDSRHERDSSLCLREDDSCVEEGRREEDLWKGEREGSIRSVQNPHPCAQDLKTHRRGCDSVGVAVASSRSDVPGQHADDESDQGTTQSQDEPGDLFSTARTKNEYTVSRTCLDRDAGEKVTYAKTAKEVCSMIKAQTPASSEAYLAGRRLGKEVGRLFVPRLM